MKKIVIGLIYAGIASVVQAEIRNGNYDGTIKCGAMLTNAAQGPWVLPIQINVAGTTISWSRSDGRYTESGSGTLQSGRLDLSLDGAWNPGAKDTGKWKTTATLNLEGSQLTGSAAIFSADGRQRFRDCSVTVPVSMSQFANVKPAIPSVISQLAAQTAGQIVVAAKQTNPALSGVVVDQVPSTGVAAGPMFSTKAQFLEKTRNGQFLRLRTIGGDEEIAFFLSMQAVLTNDYGVNSWPTERAMVNGVAVSRLAGSCKAEFEGYVKRTFVGALTANLSLLTDRPPEFNGTEQDLQRVKLNVSEYINQLNNQRDGWCGAKGTTQPYLNALASLLSEFNSATVQAVNERRSQLQVQYQREVSAEAAKRRASDDAKLVESSRKASEEKAQREKDQAVTAQRQARESGAASRNQQQIKALGFPADFVASTLYVINIMGQWSPYMPCAQWLGLLLENKKIASVQAVSVRGMPGVSIKRQGQPAFSIMFRIEGKEAYVSGLGAVGRAEQTQTLGDQAQLSNLLRILTDEQTTY